jgi:hypothetical protein
MKKKMNKYTRKLVLAVSFMIVLSLTISSTYAARPWYERGKWSGTQVPTPPGPGFRFEPNFEEQYVEIWNAIMYVTDGYEFGGKQVRYEIITYMIIFVDPQLLEGDPTLAYTAPRFGEITWLGDSMEWIGTGEFRSQSGIVGFLTVDGIVDAFELQVTGKFWVEWVQNIDPMTGDPVLVPLLKHKGWYTITDNS